MTRLLSPADGGRAYDTFVTDSALYEGRVVLVNPTMASRDVLRRGIWTFRENVAEGGDEERDSTLGWSDLEAARHMIVDASRSANKNWVTDAEYLEYMLLWGQTEPGQAWAVLLNTRAHLALREDVAAKFRELNRVTRD